MNKLLLLVALALLTQCAGCKTKDPTPDPPKDPLSQLPAETQTGAGTFGCLVNGQAWTPAGNPFGGPLLAAEYYRSRLGIGCRRVFNNSNGSPNTNQSIEFAIDSITRVGTYLLDSPNKKILMFSDYLTNCQYITGGGLSATVQITRLDLVNRIVSGRFFFTLEKPGCGQVVVTNGRFDCPF